MLTILNSIEGYHAGIGDPLSVTEEAGLHCSILDLDLI